MAARLPLVVIAGPTASGKTSLAIELAEQFGGEIICADSRTVYRYMDIGTAKPSVADQARVAHWGLDLLEPGERFTVVDFKQYAEQKIEEIRQRGHIPFLVGGTGLYIDAIVFDYRFPSSEYRRDEFDDWATKDLHKYCIENNIKLPENKFNKRYIIRAIERNAHEHSKRSTPIHDCVVVAISTDKEILRSRIVERAEHIFENGVVEEATKLGKKYGWISEAMTGNIYPLVRRYINNELTAIELKAAFIASDWKLAKRQLTWLRRNSYVRWGSHQDTEQYLKTTLASV